LETSESVPGAAGRPLAQAFPAGARRLDPYRVVSWLGLALIVAFVILVRNDVGITFDEELQVRYGRRILAWYASGFRDGRALSFGGVLVYYGGLFDALAQIAVRFSPMAPFATRHVASGLCAVLGIVASWKMATRLGGSRAGLIAGSLLALTPAWIGHGMFNPKDIPFGAAAAWATYGTLCIATGPVMPSWSTVALCGVSIGAALGVRPGGMFLLAYPALAALARAWVAQRASGRAGSWQLHAPVWRQTALRLGIVGAIAWLGMLVAWPWAQLSPVLRPLQAALAASHFSWRGKMLFAGKLIESTALPHSYLPTWFAVTLPETYALTLLCAIPLLWLAARRRRSGLQVLGIGCLVLAVLLPLVGVLVTQPVLYDGHRHFLFVLPPMAALAGYAFSEFLVEASLPAAVRGAALLGLVALAKLVLWDMATMHPYEYSYFNRLSGGLAAARTRFETDYWGASYSEGIAWVVEHVAPLPDRPLRVASCNVPEELDYFLQQAHESPRLFQLESNPAFADIFLATTRADCHKTAGEVLHVVERMGVPLLYVIRLH
jgi:hypothetical protein